MALKSVKRFFNRIVFFMYIIIFRLVTLFYRRPLIHFTISPIREIISDHTDPIKLQCAVKKFRLGKQYEQKLVSIASTLSAGATIGVFSWPDIATAHWYPRALFYSSLILAIFSLIGSSQQRLLEAIQCLENISTEPEDRKEALRAFMSIDAYDIEAQNDNDMSWYTCNMVFVWQSTFMLIVWSWITFMVGLMLHVIWPFLPANPNDADTKVAIWFLAVLLPILLSYAWCTWWVGYVTRKVKATTDERTSIWSVFEKILS